MNEINEENGEASEPHRGVELSKSQQKRRRRNANIRQRLQEAEQKKVQALPESVDRRGELPSPKRACGKGVTESPTPLSPTSKLKGAEHAARVDAEAIAGRVMAQQHQLAHELALRPPPPMILPRADGYHLVELPSRLVVCCPELVDKAAAFEMMDRATRRFCLRAGVRRLHLKCTLPSLLLPSCKHLIH